ncbi:MAG: fasciclin domain-containing protein [Paludibacter sp.]|nr:fasciclin domain-containing protein [Paludibacter sp.]
MNIRSLKSTAFIFSLIGLIFFSSCNSDDVGGNLYTFTDQLMGQYLESDTTLSEFSKVVDKTNIKGLLNAYGLYTCFVPTNLAMRSYYKSKGKNSLDDFTPDSLKQIAYDHLINGYSVMSTKFIVGRLSEISMSERYFSISYSPDFKAFVNKTSQIIKKDIVVHNGVLHIIDRVLDPVRSGVVEVISKDTIFNIFSKALFETGLADSLLLTQDDSFIMTTQLEKELIDATVGGVASERVAPHSRKYGYTVLMESDHTMAKYGIIDFESLKSYAANIYDAMYPEDAGVSDLKNRKNSLNRFIAYHLIDKELSYEKFIQAYDTNHQSKIIDLYEYIETMCPNTLLEVKIDRKTGDINHFNTNTETGEYIGIVQTNYDNDASNGVYHEIDNMLVYNNAVDNEISSKRLRFDFASIFPELTNNNMRGRSSDNEILYRFALPKGYLAKFECTDQTVLGYTTANDRLMNFEGDEVFVGVGSGKLYDFTFTTPPVPKGTYEIRFGYQSNGRRGVAQFYVDNVPAGVPVNLNTGGSDPNIGYVKPGNDLDDPLGFLNDKMMHNRGYMKGPNCFKSINESWYIGSSARYNEGNLRKILGTYPFAETETHRITVKGLSGGQFQIDFIEFVPTSLLDREDIN